MSQHYSNPRRASDPHALPNVEVFYRASATHDAEVVDSLGGIDFLESSDNWCTGTFWYINDIPKRCAYQRSLAREAGLRYRPRRRTT